MITLISEVSLGYDFTSTKGQMTQATGLRRRALRMPLHDEKLKLSIVCKRNSRKVGN